MVAAAVVAEVLVVGTVVVYPADYVAAATVQPLFLYFLEFTLLQGSFLTAESKGAGYGNTEFEISVSCNTLVLYDASLV